MTRCCNTFGKKKTNPFHFDIKRQAMREKKALKLNRMHFCCVPPPNDFFWILSASTRYDDLENCVVSAQSLVLYFFLLLILCISVQSDAGRLSIVSGACAPCNGVYSIRICLKQFRNRISVMNKFVCFCCMCRALMSWIISMKPAIFLEFSE